MIKLPRFVVLLRSLHKPATKEMVRSETLDIVSQLLLLEDRAAESRVLHNVNVIRTTDPLTADISQYSMHFKDYNEYKVISSYWTARMLLLRSCEKAYGLTGVPFDRAELRQEESRIAKNIIMSWEYAASFQRFFCTDTSLPLFALWGNMMNCCSDFQGTPVETVRAWILRRCNEPQMCWGVQPRNARQLDKIALVLQGGPLEPAFFASLRMSPE